MLMQETNFLSLLRMLRARGRGVQIYETKYWRCGGRTRKKNEQVDKLQLFSRYSNNKRKIRFNSSNGNQYISSSMAPEQGHESSNSVFFFLKAIFSWAGKGTGEAWLTSKILMSTFENYGTRTRTQNLNWKFSIFQSSKKTIYVKLMTNGQFRTNLISQQKVLRVSWLFHFFYSEKSTLRGILFQNIHECSLRYDNHTKASLSTILGKLKSTFHWPTSISTQPQPKHITFITPARR